MHCCMEIIKCHFPFLYLYSVCTVGQSDLPVLAANQCASRIRCSASDDAALPASSAHLQAGASDEEGGA